MCTVSVAVRKLSTVITTQYGQYVEQLAPLCAHHVNTTVDKVSAPL
jgi:hypothetical protein